MEGIGEANGTGEWKPSEVDDELQALFAIECYPEVAADDPEMARELLQCEIMELAGTEGEEVRDGEVFTDYWLYRVRRERRRKALLRLSPDERRRQAAVLWQERKLRRAGASAGKGGVR